ncbi:dipeptidase [Steroidobacter sp.]|uniref:dipeptidase n=1 Tax=Steroidobacter sp. TaxID=1978227 RepID=UPI001A57A178|nr:membrane dipeptidase [Steroidobacter sp.]MBL8267288.1 membrane dipeptidase [Steroidobacter sp.]
MRSAWAARDYGAERYRQALVIDGLSGPGELDYNASRISAFSERAIADTKQSGVSAVNLTIGGVGNGPRMYEQALESLAYYEGEITAHPDVLMKVRSCREIREAKAKGGLGLIFGFQDTSMLEGDLERLSLFRNLGVRIVQLTYNRRNLMGDGCLEPANSGLSTLGREAIAEINRLKLLLDLSHAGARTIAEGIAAARAPLAITHTGCRALVDVPRNTHDSELKALANRGGVVGIYFMPFLRQSGQQHAADLIRHLEHAVNVCGEDHVGLGTDGVISGATLDVAYGEHQRKFYEERRQAGIAAPGEAADVFNLIPEYNDPLRLLTLAGDLSRRGWPEGRIEKILGRNFARLFEAVWGD